MMVAVVEGVGWLQQLWRVTNDGSSGNERKKREEEGL